MIFEGLGPRLRPFLLGSGAVAWAALALGAALRQPWLERLGYGLLLAVPWAFVVVCAERAARRRAWRLVAVCAGLLGLAAVAAVGGLAGR